MVVHGDVMAAGFVGSMREIFGEFSPRQRGARERNSGACQAMATN
jgi:hypothetical protein